MSKEIAEKTIGFSVQTAKMTTDVLKEIFRNFLENAPKHGKLRYGSIAKQGRLESIEVTKNNIGDFLQTARKYDIDYALKRDSSTNPPTYHVFFTAAGTDIFKKAFAEYAAGMTAKIDEKSVSNVINREQIKENAKTISKKSAELAQEKHLSKSNISGR